jgi:hypothetical protein
MFVRYGSFMDSVTTKLYQQMADWMAFLLQSGNKFNGINKEISIKKFETANITMPLSQYGDEKRLEKP